MALEYRPKTNAFRPLMAFALTTTLLIPLAAKGQEATVLDTIVLEGSDVATAVNGYIAKGSTSGTKTATPLARTPQTINVVPASQIASQGATTVAQALRYTPGIVTEYRGTSNLHDETFVRGFGYVPRFVDGLIFGSGSFGQMDPWMLDRVELVKGPASVLYGQANPGGLINMTTKTANGERVREVQLTTGNRSRAGLAFDFGDKLSETVDWRLVGTGWQVDTQENGLKQRRFALAPSLRFTPTDSTTITVTALLQNEPDAGFRNFREAAGTLYPTVNGDFIPGDFLVSDPAWQRSTRNTQMMGTEVEHDLGVNTTLRARARISDIDTDYRTLTWGSLGTDGVTISRTASGGTDRLRQAVADLSVEHRFQTGTAQHTLLAGIDYQDSRRDYQWGFDFSVPSIDWTNPVYGYDDFDLSERASSTRTDSRQTGLYLQDQIEIGNWDLVAGLRLDDFDISVRDNLTDSTTDFTDQATTGRIGALYTFANGVAPYISYSTSFEPVTESSGTSTPFDPTEAEQVELGVKWASNDGRFFAQAAVFDLTQTGVLVYNYETFGYDQIGEIQSKGLELEGRAELGNGWSLIGSAAWLDAEVTETSNAADLGKTPARLPERTAALWAKYTADAGYDVALGVRYIGASQGDSANTFEVPSTTLYDLAVGYDFGKLSPAYEGLRGQINVQNLTDEFYAASCASAYACFVGMERTVTASINYKF